MLIGMMFLKNQVVYIQYHPVCYIVKLNIEMSMASLVVRLAQGKSDADVDVENYQLSFSHHRSSNAMHLSSAKGKKDARLGEADQDFGLKSIQCKTDLHITTESVAKDRHGSSSVDTFGDESPLNRESLEISAKNVV
jgi:hypothetical protein